MIIGISLLSGSIHEESRSAGVWVVELMLGTTTGIDTLQGVYSFILGNLQRLFFFFPHICIKSTFRRFLLERKKYFRRWLAGLFFFSFRRGIYFSRRYQALLEARFLLRRVTLCFIKGFYCGDMCSWRGWRWTVHRTEREGLEFLLTRIRRRRSRGLNEPIPPYDIRWL